METSDGFIEQGRQAILDTLHEAAVRIGLHLIPATLTKTAARQFRARLRLVATAFRRLLILIAAGLDLAPVTPDRRLGPARPASRPVCLVAAASADRLLPHRRPRSAAGTRACGPRPGPVASAPLLARYWHLARLLEDPAGAAHRMARRLARMKRTGEARPFCFPQTGLVRASYRFALTAEALPMLITKALKDWYDSG